MNDLILHLSRRIGKINNFVLHEEKTGKNMFISNKEVLFFEDFMPIFEKLLGDKETVILKVDGEKNI